MSAAAAARGRAPGASLALILALGLAAPAAAQTPDVAPGEAAIAGRVLHDERGDPLAGVEVVLYALPASGVPGLRRGVSDAQGRFVFEGIAGSPDTAYLVGARYAGVPFPGARVRFAPGQTRADVEVRVSEVARSGAVEVEALRIRVEWRGASLALLETWVLRNPGTRTLFVPEAERGESPAPVRLPLPPGARDLEVPFGLRPEGLVQRGESLDYYGPLYPGRQELDYVYALDASPGVLQLVRPLPLGAERVEVLTPQGGPALSVEGLTEVAPDASEAAGLVRLVGEGFAPGSALRLALRLPEAHSDPGALSVAEVQLILELDAAALRVREEHTLRVSGTQPLVAPADGPLLRIALPEGAEGVRFGTQAAGARLVPDPGGGLALLGPLPPGESTLEVVYRVPAGDTDARLARRFERPLPLLSVFVADDGRLRVSSDRLHRRRPVRSADRFYAHYEAFEVGPEETIELTLQPLARRGGLPRPLRLGLLALAALGSGALLLAPLRSAGRDAPSAEGLGELAEGREREAVYAALRDLEHDRETGKLDAEDHARMRDALRARALALLRAERERERPAATPAATADASPRCGACDTEARPGDRFCASCGEPLLAAGPQASAAPGERA